MIYCVWYPSGGFGHFVNSILNLYGKNFVRPQQQISFSDTGNSHNVDYVAPPYLKDQDHYDFEFGNLNYSVIVDNGINNESTKFCRFFPGATVIKMCYDDWSWPIVAYAMIAKALKTSLDSELLADKTEWNSNEDWAIREKYFLFLRDHKLRYAWKPDDISYPININSLLNYKTMTDSLTKLNIELEPFDNIWHQWFVANKIYLDPVLKAQDMLNNKWHDLTKLWDQAVFYYAVWCKYGVEVPHNDYANFFESQEQYQRWVESAI